MYPLLNKLFKENAIKPGVALDLGCGSGVLARFIADQGFSQVDAVDKDNFKIAMLASELSISHKINSILSKIEDFKIEPGKYNLILASYSLQFMTKENQKKVLLDMVNGLAPGGVAVFNIIGENDAWKEKWPTWKKKELDLALNFPVKEFIEIRNFNEMAGMGDTIAVGLKCWHTFEVVLVKH